MKKLRSLLLRLIVAYLLICGFMWGFQRHIVYHPLPDTKPPAEYALSGMEDLRIESSDKVSLQVWHHAARQGYPTIVYFHGNGGNLGSRAHYFRLLTDAGFGVLALEYRGYGASGGSPSEAGLYEDAKAVMKYATRTLYLTSSQIILYGESLGTGVAIQTALDQPSAALVLQSPFTSIEDVGYKEYPWLPVGFLLKDHFDSLSKIEHIRTPLLLFHGEQDTLVPVEEGKKLFEHASQPKEAVYFPDRGHNDLDLAQLTQALLSFCNAHGIIRTEPSSN